MKPSKLVLKSVMLGMVVSGVVLLAQACKVNGNEGDTCNPLVLQDECNAGLHCTQTTCTYAYCCPVDGTSSNPNCNFGGCPDEDAESDATDDADQGDSASGTDSSSGFDAASNDASDSGSAEDAPSDADDDAG